MIDIDECGLGTHQCAQDCSDTVGSYTCSCRTGYTLNADGRHCDGMIAILLFVYIILIDTFWI